MAQVINPEQVEILKPFFVSRSEWHNQIVSASAGDITGIIAGAGMTGGGLSGDVTLNVIAAANSGLTINADDMTITLQTTPGLTLGASGIAVLLDTNPGLALGAGGLTVDLDATPGLQLAAGGLAVASTLAGSGLAFASGVISVGAGDGIDVLTSTIAVDVTDFIDTSFGLTESSNNIRVNLASPSGLSFDTGALQIDDGIAGSGLAISASKVLSVDSGSIDHSGLGGDGLSWDAGNTELDVNVGDGLAIDTDNVVIDLATTSGLNFSSGDLLVGAGDGINVLTNTIEVDVTDFVGDGLVESGSDIDLGTPGTLAVATSNAVTASSHTHAITSSSNPGAAASILASDSSGHLELERLGLGVSPSYLLHIQGTSLPQIRVAYDGSNYADFSTGSGGTFNFAATAGLTFNPTTTSRFNNDVGINTAPIRTLHVLEGTSQAQFRLAYDASFYTDFFAQADGDLNIAPQNDLIFTPVGEEVVVNADVGINVLAPAYALQVRDTAVPQVRVEYDASNYGTFSVDATGDMTIGAIKNLEISPAGDVIFDPTLDDVYPNTNYDLNFGLINKKWLTIHAAELWVETLVAQNTIATIGGRILVGPTDILEVDMADIDTTMDVKYPDQFSANDTVYLEANGKVEFIKIVSGPTGGGPYQYTVTRNLDGSGANDWFAGDAVFNTGNVDDGFIDLYSLAGVDAGATAGPTIVGNVRNSTTYNDWTEHWAIGNMNGIYGYAADTYGVGLGEYGENYLTLDPTDGLRFFDTSDIIIGQLTGTTLTFGGSEPVAGSEEMTNGGFETVTVSSELVSNPGFETAGAGGADIWASWTENAGDGSLANETVNVNSGADAARLTAGLTPANTYIYQDFSVTEGLMYRISFYARGSGVNDGDYRVYDVTGAADIVAKTGTGVTAGAYSQVTDDVIAPVGCTTIRVYFYACPEAVGGAVYVDDVSATSRVIATWTNTLNSLGNIIPDEVVVHGGTYSAKLTRASAGAPEVELSQGFTSTAHRTYRLDFWTRGDGTYAGTYRVGSSAGAGDLIAETSTGVTAATWTQVTIYFTERSASSTITLYLGAPNSVGFAHFDDVSLLIFDGASTFEASAANGLRFFNSLDEVTGQWLEDRLTLGKVADEHIEINAYGLEIKDGSTVWTTLAAGELALGQLAGDHVLVDTTGLSIKNSTTVRGHWQTDGDIFIGSDVSLPAETYLSVFSQGQTYNTESMGAGDLLIGDNSGDAELLTDGGLEIWSDAFTLTNWTETGGGNLDRESGYKHGGTYSAKISHAAGTNKIYQAVTVTGSTRYLFTGFGDPGASDSISESYAIYDVTNASYIVTSPATNQTYYSWTRFQESFTTPSNTTQIRVELWGSSAASMYWDDVSLVEGPYLNFMFDKSAGTLGIRRGQADLFEFDSLGDVVYGKHLYPSDGIVTLGAEGLIIDRAYTEGPGPATQLPGLTILDSLIGAYFLTTTYNFSSNGTTWAETILNGPQYGAGTSLTFGFDGSASDDDYISFVADIINIVGDFSLTGESTPVWGSFTRAASTAATSSATVDVTFTAQVADTDSMWASGSDIDINTTGVYVMLGEVTWANPSYASGTNENKSSRQLLIRKDSSSDLGQTRIVPLATLSSVQQVHAMALLTAGDTVQLTLRHLHGSNLNYSAAKLQLARII